MVYGDGRSFNIKYSTVRVHPGMKFHSPFMRFADHEFKRVIIGHRGPALFACQEFTPGFIGGGIRESHSSPVCGGGVAVIPRRRGS